MDIWNSTARRSSDRNKVRSEKKRDGKDQRGRKQKREDAGARKCRKVTKHREFPMFCGFGGLKSRLAKAAGAEPARQMKDEKVHAVVARSTCVKSVKH